MKYAIIVSDGDIDYTNVYGTFDTETEAYEYVNSVIPKNFDHSSETQIRVIQIEDKEDLSKNF